MNPEIRQKIKAIIDKLWAGGISDPITYIVQLSYLIYLKMLDDEESRRQHRIRATGKESSLFPGKPVDSDGRSGASEVVTILSNSYATRCFPTWPVLSSKNPALPNISGTPRSKSRTRPSSKMSSTSSIPSHFPSSRRTPRGTSSSTCSPTSSRRSSTASSAPRVRSA